MIRCQGEHRRAVRLLPDGGVVVVAERYQGRRFNRPNDGICRSAGSALRTSLPLAEWELPFREVYV